MNQNDVLGTELVDELMVMLVAEGRFVEFGDGAVGGDVGSREEGGSVKLRDGTEGGDVSGRSKCGFVELGKDGEFEDLGLRVWRE